MFTSCSQASQMGGSRQSAARYWKHACLTADLQTCLQPMAMHDCCSDSTACGWFNDSPPWHPRTMSA